MEVITSLRRMWPRPFLARRARKGREAEALAPGTLTPERFYSICHNFFRLLVLKSP